MIQDFRRGLAHAGVGVKFWASNPKYMLLGAIPAIIVSAVMFGIIVWSVPNTYAWMTALTGFASDWATFWSEALRITLALAASVGIIFLCIIVFVALTLTVGSPFYERIWRAAEEEWGGIEGEVSMPISQLISRGIGDAVKIVWMGLKTTLWGLLIGLIPVVGGGLAAAFVAVRGSRTLAIELAAFGADARGWSFEKRINVLDARPGLTLGTVLPFYLAFLVPLGAVVAMPSAVVGASHMLRDLALEETEVRQ